MTRGIRNTEADFWALVDKSGDCWLWTAAKLHGGHGQFKMNGPSRTTHRISWEMANGPIPDGLYVCHKCDVPACVNPEHLFLGTQLDNMRDAKAKGRHRSPPMKAPGEARAHMLRTVIPAARAWHASPEGLAWHSQHGKDSWKDRPLSAITCSSRCPPSSSRS